MSDDKPDVDEAKKHVASDPEGSVQTTETEPTPREASELKMSSGKKPDEPVNTVTAWPTPCRCRCCSEC
jgi:hypothetical protein